MKKITFESIPVNVNAKYSKLLHMESVHKEQFTELGSTLIKTVFLSASSSHVSATALFSQFLIVTLPPSFPPFLNILILLKITRVILKTT